MADENSPSPIASGEGGGPPSDIGTATPVVVEKVNAPPAVPAPAPKVETPPVVAKVDPPAPAPKAPPAAEPPPKPAAKSLADEPPAADPEKQVVPADWPEDWRQKMAKEDLKKLKRAERFSSPTDILNAYLALESRLSSGEYAKKLPNNYSEEELTEYRKSNGIPDKPEGYDTNLGNGFVWGEADKPLLNDWTAYAHRENIPQEFVKKSLAWFAHQEQEIADQVALRDENEKSTGGEALRAEWGPQFKPNLNAARNMFEGASVKAKDGKPVSMFDLIMNARDEEGTRIGNRPEVLVWAANTARQLNPYATLVPDNGASAMQTAEAEKAGLEVEARDKTGPYWKGALAEKKQARWRELHEMIERGKGKNAA